MVNDIPASLLRTVSAIVPDAEELCKAMIAISTRIEAAKGNPILREGNICRHIYFVSSGCLRAYALNNGIEINTDFIFEGGFATSLRSLRSASGSDISIQAYEPSELYRFEGAALLDLYTRMSGAEAFGRTVVEQVLIRQEEHANMFRQFTGKERYLHLLATRPEIIQRVSLSQMASYIGIARETLSRIRRP